MIRADKRRYHYIYKTTCIITNRFYIGMHSTENLNDGYIGSGTRLWRSINKHGKENHVCEILEYLDSRKELAKREKEIITEEMLGNSQCMNLTLGGRGSWHACNSSGKAVPIQFQKCDTLQRCLNGVITRKKRIAENPEYGKAISEKISKSLLGNKIWLGRKHTEETKEKMRKSKNCGIMNSQFGTCWISHELVGSKKCSKELLPEYIEQGWIKGRNLFLM